MNNSSDTPRVDAVDAVARSRDEGWIAADTLNALDLARQLERELAEARGILEWLVTTTANARLNSDAALAWSRANLLLQQVKSGRYSALKEVFDAAGEGRPVKHGTEE